MPKQDTTPTKGTGLKDIEIQVSSILNVSSDDLSLKFENFLYNKEAYFDCTREGQDIYDPFAIYESELDDASPENISDLEDLIFLCKKHHCSLVRVYYA